MGREGFERACKPTLRPHRGQHGGTHASAELRLHRTFRRGCGRARSSGRPRGSRSARRRSGRPRRASSRRGARRPRRASRCACSAASRAGGAGRAARSAASRSPCTPVVIAVRSRASVRSGNSGASRSRSSRGGSVASERVEEVVGQLEVPVAVVLLDRPAHADRAAVLVEVADLGGLELVHARPALVDDRAAAARVGAARVSATRSTCSASGGGTCGLRSFGSLTRLSRATFGSMRVVVEHHARARSRVLRDRLALVAGLGERGDERGRRRRR